MRLGLGLALVLAGVPAGARAQVCSTPRPEATRTDWSPLLSRPISLHARDLALRSALDRVAAAAHIRLSYSADLLPSTGPVCASWDGVAAGDALLRLVGDALEPVVAGADLVVLTPRPARAPAPAADLPPVVSLDPMHVTADASLPTRSSQAVVHDVIDGRELSRQSATSMAAALNGLPGVWIWNSPTTGLSHYGSVRGASSFGVNSPKVYIDGIEVANPLLLARISPDAIDRIEIIRGPQGSAMYGADALGGVTNIITRQGARAEGAPRAQVRAGFGLGSSQFVTGGSIEQNHSIGIAAGSPARSASLDIALGSVGPFVPGAFSEHVAANASGRLVGPDRVITGTLRLLAQQSGTPTSPLLDSLSLAGLNPSPLANATAAEISLRQYTLGVNAIFSGSPVWTHTLVAGFDGYTLDGVPDVRAPWQTPADSVLRAAGSNAIRGTMRMSSAARFVNTDRANATLTLSAEHSVLRQRGGFEFASPEPAHSAGTGSGITETREYMDGPALLDEALLQRTNTGLSAQLDAGFGNRLFVTGGIRLERDGGASLASRTAALPAVGATWLAVQGPLTVKLRTAYGKGIRWPQLPVQIGTPGMHALHLDLGPEEQAGIEAGIDLAFRRWLTFRVTRFDQTATGLIQQVGMADTSRWNAFGAYLANLQNLGEITNRGWELQASAQRGRLSLASALSFVDSRIGATAGDYSGELRQGDRMLAVPARTFSMTAGWNAARWSASLTGYRAADWINYDRIALARALSSRPVGSQAPLQLRDYWREYEGNTHLRATFARELRRGMTLMLTADNLLDLQVGEPDNITILPGRALSLGLRASF